MLNLITIQSSENILTAVKTGFMSWGLLALGLGVLFLLILLLSKLTGKKDE